MDLHLFWGTAWGVFHVRGPRGQGLVFRGVVGFCMIHGCITIYFPNQPPSLGTQLGGEVPLLSGYIRYWVILPKLMRMITYGYILKISSLTQDQPCLKERKVAF